MPIRAVPYQHQREAYELACRLFGLVGNRVISPGAALLMEMGTGKSLTAIAIAGSLYLAGKIRRLLVVCPLSITGVWQSEFEKFAGFDYTLAVLEGSGAKKADTLRHLSGNPLQVAVVNYESARILETEIAAWKPDMIICDEAHKLKTHNTAVSKAMHRLGAKVGYRLLLTGTVITNRASDVFSQYKFLNPAIFGNSFYSFRNKFFDMVGYGNYTPRLKRTMEPEFLRRVHSIAYTATKAGCLDLPETTDIVRLIELEPSAAKLYQDISKECFAELGGGEISVTNILTKILRLSQLTGGFITDDDGDTKSVSKAKLDALTDIIESIVQEGKKLVIICKFTPEIAAVKWLLGKMEIEYAGVDGSTKNRAEEVRRFQENPDVSVFVGQIACASLGLTLTAASDLVFYSLDYSTANHSQARARIHRSGQTQKCNYYYLLCKGTIDEKILKSLRDKSDFARSLIDDFRQGRNPFI